MVGLGIKRFIRTFTDCMSKTNKNELKTKKRFKVNERMHNWPWWWCLLRSVIQFIHLTHFQLNCWLRKLSEYWWGLVSDLWKIHLQCLFNYSAIFLWYHSDKLKLFPFFILLKTYNISLEFADIISINFSFLRFLLKNIKIFNILLRISVQYSWGSLSVKIIFVGQNWSSQ